jgi:hypothetical protein
VAQFDANLSSVDFSTYLVGGADIAYAVDIEPLGDVTLVVPARNNATNSLAAVSLKLARSVDGGRACVAATLAL